ncbi:2513_t:CDS:1, partial [Cetraspora pellucida]
WCWITIPILWQDPFRYCKRDKNDSLKRIIYYYLNSTEQRNFNYNFGIINHPMFDYLKFIKHVNATHIHKILRRTNRTIITIELLLRSSNIVKYITLQNNENFKSLKKYMENHEIDLILMNPILLSQKFKFKYANNL